jgi:hypothetical protein
LTNNIHCWRVYNLGTPHCKSHCADCMSLGKAM